MSVGATLDHEQEDDASPDAGPQRDTRGVLLSPALDQEEWSCLRLVYQITGSGSLGVLRRSRGKSFDRPLWSSRTPSDSWIISSVDLQNTSEPYRVKERDACLTRRPGEDTPNVCRAKLQSCDCSA